MTDTPLDKAALDKLTDEQEKLVRDRLLFEIQAIADENIAPPGLVLAAMTTLLAEMTIAMPDNQTMVGRLIGSSTVQALFEHELVRCINTSQKKLLADLGLSHLLIKKQAPR